MARGRNANRRKAKPPVEALDGPTAEQMAKGNVVRIDMIHADTAQRVTVHKVSNIIDRWFEEKQRGFEEPARAAIDWCQARWEARGTIGRLCANYSPTVGTGGGLIERDIQMRDELDDVAKGFPVEYWRTFENLVRWGHPAGAVGSDWENNAPQAVAHCRAVVGMVANIIAMRMGA